MKFRFAASIASIAVVSCLSFAARADNVDPAAVQLSKQLLETMHVSAMADQMTGQMVAAMTNGLNAANPGKGKDVEDLMNAVVVPELRTMKPELLDSAANIYAANFTVGELKQILAFYQSDIGQKMVDRQPTILAQQNQVAQGVVRRRMPDIETKLKQAIQARGLNKPQGL